jgi:acyl carrier protein
MNDEIVNVLNECLRERPSVLGLVEITGETDPQKDLGIDSLEGIEITCELSKRLGIEIPVTENILVMKGESGCKRMRKVAEIASRLSELQILAPQP